MSDHGMSRQRVQGRRRSSIRQRIPDRQFSDREPRYAPLMIKHISEASHSGDDKSNFVLSGAHVVNVADQFKSLPSGGNVEAGEIPSLADLGMNHTANMSR
ncbi:hypothetical protein Tco_1389244, partial [Tanacetum coccineum]